MPPRRGEAGAPLPTWRSEELFDEVLYHGLPRGWRPLWVEPMKATPESPLLWERLKLPK
jgi:hypothetical protein